MSISLSIICLRPYNVFSLKVSSILTIKHFFKLYKSGLQVICLNLDNLNFLGNVDTGGFLYQHISIEKF